MQQLLAKLNNAQKEAVRYTDGPLLVIAGAGSGKTRVITNKIAYLISECGYLAKNITAITFTNKAAQEMLERSRKLMDNLNTRGLTISTFHSLGLKILKEESHHINYKNNFSILDSYDSGKIINDIATTTDKSLIKALQSQISNWKNKLYSPEYLLSTTNDKLEIEKIHIYMKYQDTLKTYQAVDFDDLIKLPLDLLENNPEVLYKWQQKIQYLLIDEYQDTNECQYRLIKALANRNKQFTVVGDDDQSIYAWRGANVENIHNLNTDFEQLKVIKLEQNYRSTLTILNAANSLISNNPTIFKKKLWSEFGSGSPIRIIECKNDEHEADTIIRKIKLHQLQHQSSFSDYAILYRGNHQSRVLEQSLRNYQIPYHITGGQSFFEKAEIKDITAYLRLIVNEDDDTAFIRAITTPKRGIGQITLDKLSNYALSRKISLFQALFEEGFNEVCNQTQLTPLIEFGNFINNLQFKIKPENIRESLMELITNIGYEEYLYEVELQKGAEKRWGNILNLVEWLSKRSEANGHNLSDLVQTITLITMLENNEKEEIAAVKLSTLHAAKGLEYPYVFLIGCEEGILPHHEAINNQIIDEERRLIYVGITRAQQELLISYCSERKQSGELQKRDRSRFISEIGLDNIIDEVKQKSEKITNSEELKNRLEQLKNLLK